MPSRNFCDICDKQIVRDSYFSLSMPAIKQEEYTDEPIRYVGTQRQRIAIEKEMICTNCATGIAEKIDELSMKGKA